MIEADDGVLNDDLATVVRCESHKLHAVFNSNWCQGSWLGNFENGVNVFDLTNSDVFFGSSMAAELTQGGRNIEMAKNKGLSLSTETPATLT